MRLLIVWNDMPSPHNISAAKPFFLLKHSKKYNLDVTIVAFKTSPGELNLDDFSSLGLDSNKIKIIDVSNKLALSAKLKLVHSVKNRLSFSNIFDRDYYFFDHIYFPEMSKEIRNLLGSNSFDLIYSHRSMIYYLPKHRRLPIILDFEDPILYLHYQLYLQERKNFKKLLKLIRYYLLKYFIVHNYRKFSAAIHVSSIHMDLMKHYLPKHNFVVPDGIDIEYFKPQADSSDRPSLVFTGKMDYFVNEISILNFHDKIFSLIKKEIANTKLYVVGKDPTNEIKKMSSISNSIIVTGYVEDIRPYINRATIAIAPIIVDDGGFKIKILESMAMGKVVISTSMGAKGLNVTPNENIIIADNSRDFSRRVIQIINNEGMRKKIESNARNFIEEEYSWEKIVYKLNKIFQDAMIINENP